jgi:hypothetical protein
MMAVLSTTTKGKAGVKAAKTAVQNPGLLRFGSHAAGSASKLAAKAGRPVAKRRVQQRAEQLGDAARSLGEALVTYGPEAAYELGLAERPKPKRTAPRVAVGIAIGAGAMYFLEPEHGGEHRKKVSQLVP